MDPTSSARETGTCSRRDSGLHKQDRRFYIWTLMLYTPTSTCRTPKAVSSMFLATVHPVEAYHKRDKPSGASVKHRSAFKSWDHDHDSAYTTTAFDAFSSHRATTSSNSTGLQQLYSERYAQSSSCGLEQQTIARDDVQGCSVPRHSPHNFGKQQSGVSMQHLGQYYTHENPDCSPTIDPTSYRAFFGESESHTVSR
jgi:hypothetical protein